MERIFKKPSEIGCFSQEAVYRMVRVRIPEKKYKKSVIKNVWKTHVQTLVNQAMEGNTIKFGDAGKVFVEGEQIGINHPFNRLLKKGLCIVAGGLIKPADNMNMQRRGVIYKFKVELNNGRLLYFDADRRIRTRLNKELENPLRNYKIVIKEK